MTNSVGTSNARAGCLDADLETLATPPPEARGRDAGRRFRALASNGTASVIYGALVTNLLRIVSSITLTRLLDAEAFGVIGIITSTAFVLSMLSDIGVQPFLVRHAETDDAGFLDRIWTLRLLRSLALTALMAALAWPIAYLIGKPILAPVLAVWSLTLLIDGMSSLTFAVAIRQGRLWRLASLETIASVVGLVLSILFAVLLRSYWALVAGTIISAVIKAILSYAMFPGSRRRFVIDGKRAREVWQFSRFIATSSFLTLLIMQTDKLVLARLMPLQTFGLYAMATTLAAVPLMPVNAWATRVLYPIYAARAREGAFLVPPAYYDRRRWVMLGYMGMVGGLIGSASLIVAILYDPRYAGVAPLLQIVAISTALYGLTIVSEEALVAAGQPRWTLYGNIARIVWLGVGGALALVLGNVLLLIVVVGTREIAAVLSAWLGLRRAGLLDLREEALGFAALTIGAIAGYGGATGVLQVLPGI